MAFAIEIGNTHQLIPPREQQLDRSATFKKAHDWRLYAKVVEGDEALVHAVEFQLHSTFQPATFKKTLPPFETRQQSYGPFTAQVKIKLADGSTQEFDHHLVLDGTGAKSTRRLQLAPNRVASQTRPLAQRPFGIELELTTSSQCSLEEVRSVLSTALREEVVHAGCGNQSATQWKLVPDASVHCGVGDRGGCNPFELVSPKLCAGAGLSCINQAVRALHEKLRCSVSVNASTGFHVHIEVQGATLARLKSLCCAWIKYEDALDLLVDPSRRGDNNEYSKSNRHNAQLGHLANDAARDKLAGATTIAQLHEYMNPSESRYFKLNLRNLASGRQPTVEVRMHEGTADYERISSWVRLLVAFVEHAVDEADRNPGAAFQPATFAGGRASQEKLARLFEWVVKDRKLRDFYLGRSGGGASSCSSRGKKRLRSASCCHEEHCVC